MALPCVFGGGCGDALMWEVYIEYADIATSDEPPSKIKARLSALSVFAESQGLTGHAALDGLTSLKSDLAIGLSDFTRFSLFYGFVFFICRERGQKSLAVNMAVHAWRLSMDGRFRLLDQWCTFVQKHQRYAISEDTWRQLLEFSQSVSEDLSSYDPEGAWPVLVDDFVDSLYRRPACTGGSMDASCTTERHTLADVQRSNSESAAALEAPSSSASMRGGSVTPSKRQRSDSENAEVECIVQRLAEMSSTPASCKRFRCCSSPNLIDGVLIQETMNVMPMESEDLLETAVDVKHCPSQQEMSWPNMSCVDMFNANQGSVLTFVGGQFSSPGG